LGSVLVEAAEQAGACGNALFLYDAASHTLSMRLFVRDGGLLDLSSDPRLAVWRDPVPAAVTPFWANLLRSRSSSQPGGRHPDAWPFAIPWHESMGHSSLLCVPLLAGDQALGFMGMCFRSNEAVASERVELPQALANQATLALELTRLSDAARHVAIGEERNRAAREIHDTLAQCFTSIFLQLQAAADFTAAKADLARACVARAEALARDGLSAARQSVATLLPDAAEYSDLPGTLARLAERATSGTTTPALVEVLGEPRVLPPELGRTLLRVAQEAFGNAQRYAAGASRIRILLEFADAEVTLIIEDDGAGFDTAIAETAGFSLASMRQRAVGAALHVDSARGRGTSVHVRAPLPSSGDER